MIELQEKFKNEIDEMVETCHRVSELGFVHSHGGNLSWRVDDDVVIITPTQRLKRTLEFEDICIMDMQGSTLYAPVGGKPTGEWPFHLLILQNRDDLKALVHAHPPMICAFAISGNKSLELPMLPEPILESGPMIMVDFAAPYTDELANNFLAVIDKSNSFIMENHGAIVGSREGIDHALEVFHMLEAQAAAAAAALSFGKIKPFSKEEVKSMDFLVKDFPPGKPKTIKSLVDLYEWND